MSRPGRADDRSADRVQVGIGQHAPPVVAQADAGIVEIRAGVSATCRRAGRTRRRVGRGAVAGVGVIAMCAQ